MYFHARPERALVQVRFIALVQGFGSRFHVKPSGLGHLWRRHVGLRASLGMIKTAADAHFDALSRAPGARTRPGPLHRASSGLWLALPREALGARAPLAAPCRPQSKPWDDKDSCRRAF